MAKQEPFEMAKPPGAAVEVRPFKASFSVVLGGLVRTYNIPPKALGAFRGRLGHLQRRGLFGGRHMPGRGVALTYKPDQLHRLIFACEALEFGFSPALILDLVRSLWVRKEPHVGLNEIFAKAEAAATIHPGPNGENTAHDIVLHFGGVSLLTDAWSNAVPNVNFCELHHLPNHMAMWMRMVPDDPAGLPPRALVTNLSMRLRAFHRALVNVKAVGQEYVIENRTGAGGNIGLEEEPTAKK
jgi:hypothetical protein